MMSLCLEKGFISKLISLLFQRSRRGPPRAVPNVLAVIIVFGGNLFRERKLIPQSLRRNPCTGHLWGKFYSFLLVLSDLASSVLFLFHLHIDCIFLFLCSSILFY